MNIRTLLTVAILALAGPAIAYAQAAAVAGGGSFQDRRGPLNYPQQRDLMGAQSLRVMGNPMEIIEAGKLIRTAGATCQAVDARSISHGRTGDTYEVACKDELGWIVTGLEGKASAYDCMSVAVAAKLAGPRSHPSVCRLPFNVRQEVGLTNLAKRAGVATCEVTKAVYLGSGGAPPISRYELACKDGAGYLLDAPTPGSQATLAITDCAKAAQIGGACSLKR